MWIHALVAAMWVAIAVAVVTERYRPSKYLVAGAFGLLAFHAYNQFIGARWLEVVETAVRP